MFAAQQGTVDLAATAIAVVVAGVLLVSGARVGRLLGVMAKPDARRRHGRETPQAGGIAIICGLLCWIVAELFWGSASDHTLLVAVALSVGGVGLIGFADDQTGLSPVARVLLLIVFLLVAFALDQEFLTNTLQWTSFAPTRIPPWLYVSLMVISTVGIVNAINMADGQDGVVGSMFVVWASCLWLATDGVLASLAGVVALLSLAFLVFNLGGKLFLGDCGSYGVGFTLGLLCAVAHARGVVSLEVIIVWFFIPVADCIRLLVSRPLRGRSPFLGDRDHLHHRLEDKMGKQKGLACYVTAVTASSLVATLAPRFSLVCLCMLSAFYFSFAWLTDSEAATAASSQPNSRKDGKVVPISSTRGSNDRRQGTA